MGAKGRFLKVLAVCIAAGLTGNAQAAQEEMTINGIQCVLVEKGTFTMGSPTTEEGRSNEEIQHQVTLTKDYWVSKYPVTQKQYQAVIGKNPSTIIGDNYPVNTLTYDEAVDFCAAVGGRLLTEAEWEFAARGGNKSHGYIYSGSNTVGDVAWYDGNSGVNELHPVGQKAPNELGIYDMSGSIYDWCSDWHDSYYYYNCGSAVTDPTGPSGPSGEWYRVVRGGSWRDDARSCRVANRYCGSQSYGFRYTHTGLRVAFNPYKIKFEANGGLAGDDTGVPLGVYIGVTANRTIAQKPSDPTKTAYKFSGWWTASSGGRQWDFDNDIVTQDTILYAQWTAKEKVAKPTVTNTALVYTGGEQAAGIATNANYKITGGTATNAGSHSATVSLNDTVNYAWADETTADFTLPWSIAKAKIIKPVVKSVLLYTGKEQAADIATNAAYTIRGGTAMYEGNHTALVTLNDTANYSWSDGTTDPLALIFTIAKANAKVIKVVWGVDTQLVYNKMVQHPQWSIEPDIIDKRYLRINNARSEVGKYTAENNLAPYISILSEYNTSSGDYILTNTSIDYEITPKPLKVALKDNAGKITSEVSVAKKVGITVGGALDSLKAFIGYDGFATDTVSKQSDNAANSLSGAPEFEISRLESGTRSRSTRDGTLKIGDLIENGDYKVSIKVGYIIAQNYALNEGQAVLTVSDLLITFSTTRDGDDNTPIRDVKKTDKKHGILLEKSVVSQFAKISVKTPEQAQINLAVYDNTGNVVFQTSGKNTDTFVWDLTNAAGRNVANGSYLIIAEAKGAKGTYAYSAKVGVKK